MAILFADRVRVVTATTGTGTINLGAATLAFRSFAQAVTDGALVSGCTVYYTIQDTLAWECGTGLYTTGSPDTLARTVNSSSNGGTTLISLSGNAQVAITETQVSAVTAAITGGTINGATIGATTPASGVFSLLTVVGASTLSAITVAGATILNTLMVTSTVYGAGVVALHSSPGPIGNTSASSGAFTTLSATGAVTGAGITALMASPGAIGGTTPSTGSFTTLNATSMPTPGAIGTTAAQGLTSISFGATTGQYINLFSTTYGIGISSSEFTTWTAGTFVIKTQYTLTTTYLFTFAGSLAGSNVIVINQTSGSANPAFTTRSAGTKLVLSPLIGASSADYALGITTNALWFGVPTSTQSFIFFAGLSTLATLTGAGALTVASTFTATGGIISTAIGASGASSGAFTTLTASGAVSGTIAPLASPAFSGTPSMPTGTTAITQTAGNSTTALATTAFVRAVASATSVTLGWFSGAILVNGTYYFTIFAPYAGTITAMNWYSGTGTFTANVGIIASGGVTGTPTSVTGLSAVAVTSTQTQTNASAANVFAGGNVIQVIITSAASSPTNCWLTLQITKT